MFKQILLHKMKIHDHGLSPLLMQNSYSKLNMAIKTLSADRISKNFAGPIILLLGQIKIKIFSPHPTDKNCLQKFRITVKFPNFGHKKNFAVINLKST